MLMRGCDLLTFGGYAFDVPLVRTESGYRPTRFGEVLTAELLNANPSFETMRSDGEAEGWQRTSKQHCFVTTQIAHEGQKSAAVRIAPDEGAKSAAWIASVPVQAGERLRLSGWVKTEAVQGNGYAFLAYYPFSGNQWVNPRDIAQIRGTTDWRFVTATFVVPFGVERVEVRFGIYNAVGTAYFDEVRLKRVELPLWVNTRYGEPHDGLEVSPLQLGMFDAHHPLRNAVHLRSAAPFLPSWEAKASSAPFTGFSTVGVLRQAARWQPLVNALDRFGRLCGTAAAWLQHYAGPFAGGNWLFFGVDNIDLT